MSARTLNDLFYAWLTTQLSAAIVNGTADATPGSGSSGSGTSYGNTVGNVDVKVVPVGAAAVITSIPAASLPSGVYSIDVIAGYGATAESATDFNMQLVAGGANGSGNNVGGTVVSKLLVSGANIRTLFNFKRTLTGSQDLAVTTTSAGGSAGSVYLASIYATKIGG